MNREEIIEKVNRFLVDEFEIDPSLIAPEAHIITDLGLESLDLVDIVVIIEKEFGFKVLREDMTNVKTLDSLYSYIEKCVNK